MLSTGCFDHNKRARASSSAVTTSGSTNPVFNGGGGGGLGAFVIVPATASIGRNAKATFQVSGAQGIVTWSVESGPGSIDGGVFTAPAAAGTSVIRAVDTKSGIIARATVKFGDTGDPDPDWGNPRQAVYTGPEYDDIAYKAAIQPATGKMVVVGKSAPDANGKTRGYAIIRLTATGQRDTFPENAANLPAGVVAQDLPPALFVIPAVDENGQPDVDGSYEVEAVLAQPDGAIVIVGSCFAKPPRAGAPRQSGICMVRLRADGSLDSTFNNLADGTHPNDVPTPGRKFFYATQISSGTEVSVATDYKVLGAALEPNGASPHRVIVAGQATVTLVPGQAEVRTLPIVGRVLSNGLASAGFGSTTDTDLNINTSVSALRNTGLVALPTSRTLTGTGTSTTTVLEAGVATQVARQSNGDLVVTAAVGPFKSTVLSRSEEISVFKISSNGLKLTSATDPLVGKQSFGSSFVADPYSLAIGTDDRMVVGARLTNDGGDNAQVGVLWLLPTGARDTSNGFDGRIRISPSSGNAERVQSVVKQADGKVLILGKRITANGNQDVVYRLSTDGQRLDPSWADGGISTLKLPPANADDPKETRELLDIKQLLLNSQGNAVCAGSTGRKFYIQRLKK